MREVGSVGSVGSVNSVGLAAAAGTGICTATPDPWWPLVEPFFHTDTGTFTYVVHEGDGGAGVIIDPVLDYDAGCARTGTRSADTVVAFADAHALRIEWIFETHAHADHLSAADYLRRKLGARLAIGHAIVQVQAHFKTLFGWDDAFVPDGRQFDRLLGDDDVVKMGSREIRTLATPGHTGDSLTYLIGDAAFIGDTLFAPDIGSARCDFPGGNAAQLHTSIGRILALPEATRLFLCHDYPPQQREPTAQTSIAAQRECNIHVGRGVCAAEFVAMREARDAKLAPPRLMLPALQVNICAGCLPAPAANGIRYLTLPLNQVGPTI